MKGTSIFGVIIGGTLFTLNSLIILDCIEGTKSLAVISTGVLLVLSFALGWADGSARQ